MPGTSEPLRIYTGILGQIGDIVMFTATVRRLKALFPNSEITFAVSRRYREAGELVAGLPYVDRLFVTDLYFEKLIDRLTPLWEAGWPVDLRGDDEVAEQRRHDLVFETRPRHRRERWWEQDHIVAECAHMVGVPGPIDLRTEIAIPPGVTCPPKAAGKIVLHNAPALSPAKAWAWDHVRQLVAQIRISPRRTQRNTEEEIVVLGRPGPKVPGVLDLRGRTTLRQAAAVIAACRGYVGIDSGLMWIAASLQAPTVGLYGTAHLPAYGALHPRNPHAIYLQADGPVNCISPEAVLQCLQQIIA